MASIKVTDVRISFPDLFKASEKFDRYGASFIIEPGSENAKALTEAVDKCAKEKWGAKADGILKAIKAKGDLGYLESGKMNSSGEVYDGYEGMHTLNTSDKVRPLVIDRDRTPLDADSGRPYAGCYVNALVEVWAQDNSWGKKINFALKGVQFVRDGEAFSGGAPADVDDFDDLASGADADDMI